MRRGEVPPRAPREGGTRRAAGLALLSRTCTQLQLNAKSLHYSRCAPSAVSEMDA